MKRLLLVLTLLLAACESQRPTPPTQTAPAQTAPVQAPETTAAPAPKDRQFLWAEEPALDRSDTRVGVLLHGYGSNEKDLLRVARSVGLSGPLIGIRAPLEAGRGWAWFPINFRAEPRYEPNAADEVLEGLADELRGIQKDHPDSEIVVLGFSQGAMMAMMLASEHPDALDRAIALSGTLPRPVTTPASFDPATAPLIYAIHGTDDDVVSLERARQAQQWLEAAGTEPTYMEYEGMGHRIGPEVIKDLRNYLARTRVPR